MNVPITLPEMKVSTKVIPGAAEKPCIGCLNISASHFPIIFDEEEGTGMLDTETQWFGLDGERKCNIQIHFCPVCGRSLKELHA